MDVDPDGEGGPFQNDDDGWIRDDPLAKNPYRLMAGEPEVTGMLLNGQRITQIDTHRHPEIKGQRWTASTPKAATSYVITSFITNGAITTCPLHVWLFPDIDPPRDHISRDKLDNRAENIRTGANGINQRNQELWSDGVYPQEERKRFRARWVTYDGVAKYKAFRWQDYPDQETCRLAAVAFRKRMADEAVGCILALQAEAGGAVIIPKGAAAPIISNTGIKGLTFMKRKNGRKIGVAGQVRINKILYCNSWVFSHYGGEEAAIEEGKRWLAQTRLEHPRQPNQKKQKRDE